MTAKILSVNVSDRKHVAKRPVAQAELGVGLGLVGDAHAGPGDRQVSLLAAESIERLERAFRQRTIEGNLPACPTAGRQPAPGALAENLTTRGLDLSALPPGTRLRIGEEVVLEISRIGKECYRYCEIYRKFAGCPIPHEAAFARVIRGGRVRPGDGVRVDY
ncbi:MAG: MOSC domain-containing protein [Anaerolineaceae bacterium]|nr:MOSC domain-containing protein [Anaerolineaceae bacterium]